MASVNIVAKMSSDGGGLKVEPSEDLETLQKEAETLKQKLEEERQKLNDVPCEYI